MPATFFNADKICLPRFKILKCLSPKTGSLPVKSDWRKWSAIKLRTLWSNEPHGEFWYLTVNPSCVRARARPYDVNVPKWEGGGGGVLKTTGSSYSGIPGPSEAMLVARARVRHKTHVPWLFEGASRVTETVDLYGPWDSMVKIVSSTVARGRVHI